MPKITVIKKFTLTNDDHTQQTFEPGEYDVDDATAKHWYVQIHGPNPPQIGQVSPFGPQVVKPIAAPTVKPSDPKPVDPNVSGTGNQPDPDDEQKRKAKEEEERAKGGKK